MGGTISWVCLMLSIISIHFVELKNKIKKRQN
jgi:hypothetical protein